MKLDNWTFGMTMLIVGMGAHFSHFGSEPHHELLKKAFPYRKEEEGK